MGTSNFGSMGLPGWMSPNEQYITTWQVTCTGQMSLLPGLFKRLEEFSIVTTYGRPCNAYQTAGEHHKPQTFAWQEDFAPPHCCAAMAVEGREIRIITVHAKGAWCLRS